MDGKNGVHKKTSTPDPRVIQILNSKTQDLVRNNSNAKRVIDVFEDTIVGRGIMPHTVMKPGGEIAKQKMEEALKRWADTKMCDADGNTNLYGLQGLIVKELVESGNVFVRRRKRKVVPGQATDIPFQLQVLSYDFLDTSKNNAEKRIINGIEYNSKMQPSAYYFFKEDPNNKNTLFQWSSSNYRYDTIRVPAKEVLHIFKKDRAGQRQGVSWFAPVISTLRDMELFMYSRLKQQQNQAAYSGFVITPQTNMASFNADDGVIDLKAGTFQKLHPGEDVKYQNNSNTNNDPEFIDIYLKNIGRGMGLEFLEYSGDYTQSNYSNTRASRLAGNRKTEGLRSKIIEPQFLIPVSEWVYEASVFAGIITFEESKKIYNKWVPPKLQLLDADKESKALDLLVSRRYMSRQQAIESLGFDYHDVMEEAELDNKLQEEIGPDALEVQQISVKDSSKPSSEGSQKESDDSENVGE